MSAAKGNFLKDHWEILVLLVGLLALAGGVVVLLPALSGEDVGAGSIVRTAPKESGVQEADLTLFQQASRRAKTPPRMPSVDGKKASFLASERRVICQKGDPESKKEACGKPIAAGLETCPLCGMKQKYVKVEVDSDHDGIPNDWEKKYGFDPMNPADAAQDADKDTFTNLEEYQAKTDPKDPASHPDYLDFLAVDGEMRTTKLPFYFNGATKIPGGHRFTFQRLGKSGYDSKFTPKLNEEIGNARMKSGWVVTAYEEKSEMRVLKGSGKSGLKRPVDVSTVTLKRTKDGKTLTITTGVQENTIECEADLVWNRLGGKKFTVTKDSEIDLNGSKYRVTKLVSGKDRCEVTVQDMKTKKEKTLR